MYKKFEVLSEEKRIRILNSAFDEFSHKKFKEASTDEIARNASISKGALFQYFGTKKQLYLYIYNYGYEVLVNELYGQVNLSNPDIIERLKEIFAMKMNLYCKYPTLSEFILFAHTMENDEIIKALTNKEMDNRFLEISEKVYANIDFSNFKDCFDPKQVLSIILWTIEGYSNNEVIKLKQNPTITGKYKKWIKEFDEYMETLKKAFYKEGN